MNFWTDKLNELRPPQAHRAPAQASWWQQGLPQTPPGSRQIDPGRAQPTEPGDYAPGTSARLEAAPDSCPRCGSDDYVEVPIDLTYGGRAGLAETGINLSKNKRCFSCRYPNANPSGEVVRGKLPAQAKVQTRHVRQAGGGLDGTWSDASWDDAPLIA